MISVIMGVLSHKADTSSLRQAVCSILEQTYTDFECLIQDDGSCLEAISLLSAMAGQDTRIRLVRGSGRQSLPEKMNECLRYARGSLIARMDDDDFSAPDRFEKQVAFLQEHPEIAFVGANTRQMREGRFVRMRKLPEYPKAEDFFLTQPFVHPVLMFRREVLDEAGGYSESRRQLFCEDYDLLLRLYEKKHYGANLQEALLDYTLPPYGKKRYRLRYCLNEAVTRYARFKALGLLPKALPYVMKPLAIGLLPPKWRDYLKERKMNERH